MKLRLFLFAALVFLCVSCIQETKSYMYDDQISTLESIPGSCTTYAIQNGDKVLFGNNEDYENPLTYYWVVPSTEDGYGGI